MTTRQKMSTREAARVLCTTSDYVRILINRGKLKSFKIGRDRFIRPGSVRDYITSSYCSYNREYAELYGVFTPKL